jgi:hypothetical protein
MNACVHVMDVNIESRKDPGMPQGWPEERRHLLSDLQTLQITMQNVQQRHDDLRLTLEQCKQVHSIV